ncbi:hypothetical protein [Candidatus Laterigemmans baculatus]|uniref:hypothetical protein n=1 Tax=Candidatus Laterigemmans baculatus TaxID=2770505 RepID=UPI0013DCF17D|nr:hypothetical protein [Candidatus Laterigemmans baculatus]
MHKLYAAFMSGYFPLLIVVGDPGRSKSWYFEQQDAESLQIIKGNASPFQTYRTLWEHRNKLIVLDDAEVLWANLEGRRLIRQATELKSCKTIYWEKASRQLEKDGIPRSFQTKSRFCIICNRFVSSQAEDQAAILDRAHFIYFDPTNAELHKYVGSWYWDQAIYDFIGHHLGNLQGLSVRSYVRAYHRKQAGIEWKQWVLETFALDLHIAVLQDLERREELTPTDRVRQFTQRTGLKKSSYYSLRKRLPTADLDHDPAPAIRLTAKPPRPPDLRAELAQIREEALDDDQHSAGIRNPPPSIVKFDSSKGDRRCNK